MRKFIVKLTTVLLGAALVMGIAANLTLAAGKELTPYEWSKLSNEDRLKYKTITIRTFQGGGTWMEEKEWKKAGVAFNEIMDTGDTLTPTQMYSKALFEYLHPKVKVKHIQFQNWGPVEYRMAAIAGGTAPSAYQIHSGGGGPQGWIKEGLVADITDLIKDWDMAPYLQKRWGGWKYLWREGRCYGVSEGYDWPYSLNYRKDWFKEAGIFNEKGEPGPSGNWSWYDLQDIAVKLTDAKKKRWGIVFGPTAGTKGNQKIHCYLPLSFGVFEPFSFCTPDKSGKYTWRFTPTPQLIKALQFIRDLRFKYNCMLTGVEIKAGKGYKTEFRPGRAAMAQYDIATALGDILFTPHLFSPEIPTKDCIGVASFPKGAYIGHYFPPGTMMEYGFDPTLNKEELRAAFEWFDWCNVGMGREIEYRRIADILPTYPPGAMPSWPISMRFIWDYPLRKEIPGIPSLTEYTPPEFLRIRDMILNAPSLPEPFEFGLELNSESGLPGEIEVSNSLFQALVADPNTTVEAELAKAADILNKSVFNFKIKDDKEKMKAYVDALTNFYKENYPEFYKSKDFEEQLNYFKVW